MNGAGAAEGEERIGAQVLAALDAVHARGGGHVLVDHAVYAPGGLRRGQPHRARHLLLDGATGRLHVEAHAPAQEEAGIEIPEEQIRVGHRRHLAARGIAGRPGIRARAVGADLEQTHAIHARQGAAPRADLDHLDAGNADGQPRALLEAVGARDLELPGEEGLALVDHAGLGGGAAHVEGEQLGLAQLARHARGREGARGWARFDETDGHALGGGRRGHPARGEHDVEVAGDSQIVELALEVVEVARHERHDVDVAARGRGPLVLADLGHHLGRGGDGHAGSELRAELLERPLVDGIAIGVEQADGDGLGARVAEPGDGRPRAPVVEWHEDTTVRGHALRHLEPQVAGDERRGRVDEDVVHVVAAFVPDLDGVAEARGGQESRPRALALDEGVGGQRRPVDDRPHLRGGAARVGEERHHALLDGLRGVLGCGQELADLDGPRGVVDPDEVGEGAADVDADARGLSGRACHGSGVYMATNYRQAADLSRDTRIRTCR